MTYRLHKRISAFALIALFAVMLLVLALAGTGGQAHADGLYDGEMILEAVASSTATAARAGVYRSIAQGDTFTITYRLVKNDGMADALFVPAYDKEAFRLTSFSVDNSHWTLHNNYGTITDPQSGLPRAKTAAEYVAERNAKYDAGLIADPNLRFLVEFPEVEDEVGVTSDAFITIVYTARTALTAPVALNGKTEYTFGFVAEDTEASKDGDHLLQLLQRADAQSTPVALGENTYSFRLIAETNIEIPADQSITFSYNQDAETFLVNTDDITLNFTTGDKTEYLKDEGAEILYTFYSYENGVYTPFTPTVPDLTNVYVSATIPDTARFDGSSADRVHIALAPTYVDFPVLRLYDSQHGDDYAEMVGDEIEVTVKYGTTYALKQLVNNEETDFAFPTTGNVLGDYYFSYQYNGEDSDVNPLAAGLDPVGDYSVLIKTADLTYVMFSDSAYSTIKVTIHIEKATITMSALIDGEATKALTYGDATPAAASFTYDAAGIFETGDARAAVIAEIGPQVTSDAPYAQGDDVGTYSYYVSGAEEITNYIVVRSATDATITVSPAQLTLSAEYENGVVTLLGGGAVNDEQLTYVYYVKGEELMGTSYAADEVDVGNALTARVTVNNANYADAELTLPVVHQVTFVPGEGDAFDGAQEVPPKQYIFHGQHVKVPTTTPTYDLYAFRGWTLGGSAYNFQTATVEENITLIAAWEKMTYQYKFRAINSEANKLTGKSYALNWANGTFTVATTILDDEIVAAEDAESVAFTIREVIPMKAEVKGFYVLRWYSVIPQAVGDPILTEVTRFDAATSAETAGAYYLAEMIPDIGKGDVNGDGRVTTLDLLSMKRFLVGGEYETIETEQEAWDLALRTDSENVSYIYKTAWDVNGDHYADTRDLVILRRALATGYGYTVVRNMTADGLYCPGDQVALEEGNNYEGRVYEAADLEELDELLSEKRGVVLTANIEFAVPFPVSYEGDVFVNLNGKTLTAESLTLSSTEGSITILNGKLAVGTLTLTAANGITITDVTDGADEPVVVDGNPNEFGWTD